MEITWEGDWFGKVGERAFSATCLGAAAEDGPQSGWRNGQRDKQCANHEISHVLRSVPPVCLRGVRGVSRRINHRQMSQQVG
jgi:hypothetical protein